MSEERTVDGAGGGGGGGGCVAKRKARLKPHPPWKKERVVKNRAVWAAIGAGACLAVVAGGCLILHSFRGPEPFVLGDGEVQEGCVFFQDEIPPAEISVKVLPAESIAALKDWSAHLHEGLSVDFVTYAPDVTVDFGQVRAYCFEEAVVVMDKRDGDAWKQYGRKATPRDKAVRALLLEEWLKSRQGAGIQALPHPFP